MKPREMLLKYGNTDDPETGMVEIITPSKDWFDMDREFDNLESRNHKLKDQVDEAAKIRERLEMDLKICRERLEKFTGRC